MNVGDLVIMPNAEKCTLRKKCHGVGLVINDKIVRSRIGILWSGEGDVDYEPVAWLEVINESR